MWVHVFRAEAAGNYTVRVFTGNGPGANQGMGDDFSLEFTGSGGGAIPEPMTMLAVGLGISGLGGYLRKRRRA